MHDHRLVVRHERGVALCLVSDEGSRWRFISIFDPASQRTYDHTAVDTTTQPNTTCMYGIEPTIRHLKIFKSRPTYYPIFLSVQCLSWIPLPTILHNHSLSMSSLFDFDPRNTIMASTLR